MESFEHIPERRISDDGSPASVVAIRVSAHSYFAVLLISTFLAAFLFYLGLDLAGSILFAGSWILIPFFALNDKISFDGKRLSRTGLLPALWSTANSSRRRLKISDIEQVETQAVRTLKRGGSVLYRYRTVIRGKGLTITISSGGEQYRQAVKAIFSRLSDNVLDHRSIELRDHLADPKEILRKAELSRIPSADVLESSFRGAGRRSAIGPSLPSAGPPADEKVDDLRTLANELRLSGHLLQALEAFRRALIIRPSDAHLLFEFARCLYSFAGVERDNRLERRALAALRLSERRAADDAELMVRLGEWYFQIGEWRRSNALFKNAVERIGENFRVARGLAELALREGKIAHVIHQFRAAGRLAESPSLRRWSKNEADYFSNLNSNDEYMELEIGRVNLLEVLESLKKTALRIAFFGLPVVFAGIFFEDSFVANIGWSVSGIGLFTWSALIFGTRLLGQRIPFELVETDE